MIELSIPQPGEESRGAKDLVFSILSREQPLSIAELARRIQREHNLGLTYQAVRKAIEGMHAQGVLAKEGKRYSISKAWALKLKSFFDNLLATYESGKRVHAFSQELIKEDYAVYTFSNLLDLDNFWNETITHWADRLKKGDNKVFLSRYNYGFWFLINLGQETKLYEHVIRKGGKPHMLMLRETPLNRWGMRLYEDVGVRIKVSSKRDADDSVDLNLLGDTVLQVKYPEKILKRLRTLYGKHRSTQGMSLKEIAQLAHEPCEIKFVMIRDAAIARSLRETYMAEFSPPRA